jgi:hypothetical protein
VWVYAPGNKFGLIGSPDKAPFSTAPDGKDTKPLGPLKLPIPAEQLTVLPLLTDVKALPSESVAATPCRVLQATATRNWLAAFRPTTASSMPIAAAT